jgi:uncharacterized protein (TIGR02444 family)
MPRVADLVQQNVNTAVGPADDDLWRFVSAYYAQPGVAAALIALQDRDGIDINLILFGLWHGVSGRGRLDRRQLAAAARATETIRVEIVEPLRALRRQLKSYPDPEIQRLREAVKSLEIEAEKAALRRLAASAAAPPDANLGRDARFATADVNLTLYLAAAANSADAAVIRSALAVFLGAG